jgi:hypothetical protein
LTTREVGNTLHPNIRSNAAERHAVLDFAVEFVGDAYREEVRPKIGGSTERRWKTSFILAPTLLIIFPEARSWDTAPQISLRTINALSGFAGLRHCSHRIADAQIRAVLQSRENVVEVGRRRQAEEHAR